MCRSPRLRPRSGHSPYMDEFVILVDDRTEARRRLAEVEAFLGERLHLRLNPRRRHVAPLSTPCDFLGYVHRPGGPTRVRRRNVRRLRRRLQALDEGLDAGTTDRLSARSSLASWVGLAGHADVRSASRGRSSRSGIRATSASACSWRASRSLVRPLTGRAAAERRRSERAFALGRIVAGEVPTLTVATRRSALIRGLPALLEPGPGAGWRGSDA